MGKNGNRDYFGGSKITADGDCNHEIKRHLLLGKENYDEPKQHIKKQRHYFANVAGFTARLWLAQISASLL